MSFSSRSADTTSGSPFMQLTQTNRTFQSDLSKEEHDMVVRRVQVMVAVFDPRGASNRCTEFRGTIQSRKLQGGPLTLALWCR